MRIEIKYESSEGSHLIDLDINELNQLSGENEVVILQNRPAAKSLHIEGNPDELELFAVKLLNRAVELRRQT